MSLVSVSKKCLVEFAINKDEPPSKDEPEDNQEEPKSNEESKDHENHRKIIVNPMTTKR